MTSSYMFLKNWIECFTGFAMDALISRKHLCRFRFMLGEKEDVNRKLS